jgi:hypothetical protein
MKIIGCDFHPGYQQIAVLDLVTGEMMEKALSHERKEEVRAFYAGLEGSVRVGIEASGQSQWFERMLAEYEVWIGDRAWQIRAWPSATVYWAWPRGVSRPTIASSAKAVNACVVRLACDLTGDFCTSRRERKFARRTAGNAKQEVQSGTDRDVAAPD